MAQQTDHIGNTNKMVTAVESLLIWFDNNNYYISSEIAQAFNKAKAMEKEQIKEAYIMGEIQQGFEAEAEQYYNQTYEKNNA